MKMLYRKIAVQNGDFLDTRCRASYFDNLL